MAKAKGTSKRSYTVVSVTVEAYQLKRSKTRKYNAKNPGKHKNQPVSS